MKKLDGYRIDDLTDWLGFEADIMKIVILYNGDSVSIVQHAHESFDDLHLFLTEEAKN